MNYFIDFLNNNKEWLFSGLGLSVIVLIYYVIRWLLPNRKTNNINSGNQIKFVLPPNHELSLDKSINNKVVPNITPIKIYEAITSAPLLQREDIAKHYIGIYIRWKGEVSYAYKKDNNIVRISLIWEGKMPPHFIIFEIDPNEFKNIALLSENDLIEVEGQIKSIDGSNIEICDISIISWSPKK